MIYNLKNTPLYKSLNLSHGTHHAYLFTSIDSELNNQIALTFAKSLICDNKTCCNSCPACMQFDGNSHPDCTIINQPTIKVDDVNKLIEKLNTKPISANVKVFVILNAENINEIAQNKLLKSLEEPNQSNIFILSCSKIDKLLPTVLSRLHKISLPKISSNDLSIISEELSTQGINLKKYSNGNITLTDILNFELNDNHKKTILALKHVFQNLKSSQDIPQVSHSLPDCDKKLFLSIMQKTFFDILNSNMSIDDELTSIIKATFSKQAIIKCLPWIEDSYKKLSSNVNFSYILDNLLFNILKEKFLCKQ